MEAIMLPINIQKAYQLDDREEVRLLGGGLINSTFTAWSSEAGRCIVQALHHDIDPVQTEDYQHISQHLRADDWEIPQLLPSVDGALFTYDETGKAWRAFEYIESDADSGEKTVNPTAYGSLLGKLHLSLGSLDYAPKFGLPHFHDTKHYARVLQESLPYLTNKSAFSSAVFALGKFMNSPELPDAKEQMIHADPKTANILSRDGVPFTFIDWDTAMNSSPWIDIGDMLRSVMNQNTRSKPYRHPLNGIYEIIEGYRQVVSPNANADQFKDSSFQAAGAIILELAMRYLADYKDGDEGYFAWDNDNFSSRHEHNTRRAYECLQRLSYLQSLNENNDER